MQRPEEGVGFSGAGIQGSCELPDMGAKRENRKRGGKVGGREERLAEGRKRE